MARSHKLTVRVLLTCVCLVSACSSPPPTVPPGSIAFDLDKSGERFLLSYWLSAYLDPPGDPFAADILYESDGAFYLAPEDSVREKAPQLVPLVTHAVIDWDVFSAFVQRTWHHAAGHPASLDVWMQRAGNWREDNGWIRIPVKGSMSPFERQVGVKEEAVRAALQARARGGELVYPEGTLFVADHVDGNRIMETTIMRKRQTGMWDYMSYDSDGQRTDLVFKEPNPLQSPIQCLGCHTGNKAFEPERSFPSPAAPGPNGSRYIDVDGTARDPVVTNLLNEHMRRSDTILGLYATVYLSRVRSRVLLGNGSVADSLLLQEQGIPIDTNAP